MERDFRTVVQSWLDGNFDEATKAQIVALQENDPVALEDVYMDTVCSKNVCSDLSELRAVVTAVV